MTNQNSNQIKMDPDLNQLQNNNNNNSNYRTFIEENKSDIKPDHYNYVINTTNTDEKFEVIREGDDLNTRNGGQNNFQDDTKDLHYRDSFYSPKNQNQHHMNFLPNMMMQDQVNSDMKKFLPEDDEEIIINNDSELQRKMEDIGREWREKLEENR